MESIILNIINTFFRVVNALHIAQEIGIWVGHWLGRFFVAAIFICAVTAVAFELSVLFDTPLFQESHWAYKVIGLFGSQKAWVAATAIVATTVAMGHFRNLDLAIEKAKVENEDRDSKKNA